MSTETTHYCASNVRAKHALEIVEMHTLAIIVSHWYFPLYMNNSRLSD